MSGAGYNDPEKLAAARELNRSFKSGDFDAVPKKNRGQPIYKHVYKATRSAPPPSQRDYSGGKTTALPRVLCVKPGIALIGNQGLSFLQRQDGPSDQTLPQTTKVVPDNAVTINADIMAAEPEKTSIVVTEATGNDQHQISIADGVPQNSIVANFLRIVSRENQHGQDVEEITKRLSMSMTLRDPEEKSDEKPSNMLKTVFADIAPTARNEASKTSTQDNVSEVKNINTPASAPVADIEPKTGLASSRWA